MKTLCLQCLRIVEVTMEDYIASDYGKGLCECGGEVCHCDHCQADIDKLLSWDWSKPCLLFQEPIFFWDPDGGAFGISPPPAKDLEIRQ